MGASLARLSMMLTLAMRSLRSHWVKSVIVGGIIFFGTFLLIVATAMLDSVERSMERSITGSVTGQLQVHDADARDELAIFGSGVMGGDDIGEIHDFSKVKSVLGAVDNVAAVVPMGTVMATVMGGNDFDRVLSDLQGALDAGNTEQAAAARLQLRKLAGFMARGAMNELEISADRERLETQIELLTKIQDDAFWTAFDADPAGQMRFLETQIAPLARDGRMYILRTIGTDLQLYADSFDRFEITDGELVPAGQRGLMLNKRMHERWLKHLVARGFDRLEEARQEGTTIAEDADLQARVGQMQRQYQEILFQLAPPAQLELERQLRAMLPDVDGDIEALLQAFLELDDDNFEARRDFFYAEIAPHIQLYPFDVGDTITVRAVTKTGYFKAVNLEVYGRFSFAGLEGSDLSGAFNLMDIMSFRDLYGLMTDAQRAELDDIREDVGVEEITRDNAEDALFGGGDDDDALVSDATETGTAGGGFDIEARLSAADAGEDAPSDTFTQADIDEGLALNAAIVLADPERTDETQAAIEAAVAEHGLGLQVVGWQSAAGMVGQFVIVIRLVLYIAITIIFLVALVIINNSMVMATMDRVGEIGTMRAIGARRGFVLSMLVVETLTLGLLAGALGAGAAAGFIGYFGSAGIPAGTNDVMRFLFSGPRLYPALDVGNVLVGLLVILAVSLLAVLYPALIAIRVQPIEAMSGHGE